MKRFFLLTLITFFIACHDNDTLTSLTEIEESGLSVEKPLAFKGRGGFRSIEVKGREWFVNRIVTNDSIFSFTQEEQEVQKQRDELVKDCGWLTLKSLDGRIEVHANVNRDDSQRSFAIELCNGVSVVTLKGTQDVLLDGEGIIDVISPSSRTVKFDSKGGCDTITTKMNFTRIIGVEVAGKYIPVNYNNWQDETLDKQFGWLVIRHETNILELMAEENQTADFRIFKVHLADGDYFTTISGIQQASVDIPPTDTIGFSPRKIHFPLRGGTVEVVARTDGWILDEKSDGLDWLTIEQETNRLKLTATPNFDYDIRHFSLRFKKGDYYEYLEGEQETR